VHILCHFQDITTFTAYVSVTARYLEKSSSIDMTCSHVCFAIPVQMCQMCMPLISRCGS